MGFVWIEHLNSGGDINSSDKVDIKNNIDDIRNRLANAGGWGWVNHPVDSETIIDNAHPNEFKEALDDSHDKNVCVDCTEYGDQGDLGDRKDQGDHVDDKDRVDVGDRNDESHHIDNNDATNDSRDGINHTD
jgi:hypothetical protein